MDIYIRLKRSLELVDWLKFQEGAVIIRNGWDMIDRTDARAEFRPQMNSAEAYQLFYQTQFICNTNPYGRDITHERVICGLLYGRCVLTDANAWWDQNFSHVQALTRFYWDRPLSDQLQPVIGNPKKPAEIGRAAAIEHFLGKKSISLMVEYADRVRAFGASFKA